MIFSILETWFFMKLLKKFLFFCYLLIFTARFLIMINKKQQKIERKIILNYYYIRQDLNY